MKRVVAVLTAVYIFAALNIYADGYIKLIADKSETVVYANGEEVGIYTDTPLEFILPEGEYKIEVKKSYSDDTMDYYTTNLHIGKFKTKFAVNAVLSRVYTEEYYLKRAKDIKGAENYLNSYPEGRYSEKMRQYIENEYAKRAVNSYGAEVYLKKYPEGRYSAKIRESLEEIYFNEAVNIAGAKKYLDKYPKGKYYSDIMNKKFYLLSTSKKNGETVRYIKRYNSDFELLLDKEIYSNGNSRTNFYEYGRDGSLKKYSRQYFEAGILKIEEERVYENNKIVYEKSSDTKYIYNNNGLITEEIIAQGKAYEKRFSYKYENNRLISKTSTQMGFKEEYKYDEAGNLIEEHRKIESDFFYELYSLYEYDSNNRQVHLKENGHYRDSKRESRSEREFFTYYDENGNIIEKRYRDSNGENQIESYKYENNRLSCYEYNKNGKRGYIKYRDGAAAESFDGVTTEIYQYDSNKNLISNGKTEYTYREISLNEMEEYDYENVTDIESAGFYLEKYPTGGKHTEKVLDFIEDGYAKSATDEAGMEQYLLKYPAGKYSEKYRNIINKKKNFIKESALKNMVAVKGGSVSVEIDAITQKVKYQKYIPDYYIGKYEVTQAEYEAVMGYNYSSFKGADSGNNPVECVTWYDAVMYCNKLSKISGLEPYYTIQNIEYDSNYGQKRESIGFAKVSVNGGSGYRIPTEAEWQWAALGEKNYSIFGKKYSGSGKIDELAWYERNSQGTTHPVGQKKPNELGLYDMNGNVMEWCWEKYEGWGVTAGGSWNSNQEQCRADKISVGYGQESGFYYIGFRIARNRE